jgi:hypothetical protein
MPAKWHTIAGLGGVLVRVEGIDSRLKRLGSAVGLTQAALAERAAVPLQTALGQLKLHWNSERAHARSRLQIKAVAASRRRILPR